MKKKEEIEYKNKLVETFRAFLDFCEKHDLQYIVCAGTCIGAVRHHGLIPWDDDIDVFMKRSDYNRLLSLRNSLPSGYKLITMGDDCYCAPIPKFCNTNTTLWEDKSLETIIGIYIDIFPLDVCCSDVRYCEKLKRKYEWYYLKYQDSNRTWKFSDLTQKLFHFHMLGFIRLLRNCVIDKRLKNFYLNRYNKIHEQIMSMTGPNMTSFDGLFAKIYPKEFFDSTLECDFEGLKVKIPWKYDDYLRMTYGDYMTPPPENKRISTHSHFFLDLKKGLTLPEVKQIIGLR